MSETIAPPAPTPQKRAMFVEVLVLITLVFPLLPGSVGSPFSALAQVLIGTVSLLTLMGIFAPWFRPLSWPLVLVTALISILFRPGEADGMLLLLFVVFLMYDAQWFASGRWPWLIGILSVLLAAQVGSLFLTHEALVVALIRVVFVDGLLVALGILFRKDLFNGSDPQDRPVLDLNLVRLTPRELEVVRFVRGGHTNKEIANLLGQTDGAVRNTVSGVYRKLGVGGTRELLTLIHSHRIVWGETGETGGNGEKENPERGNRQGSIVKNRTTHLS